MSISDSQVEHIATLARLHLSTDEKMFYQKQMQKVLDYVKQLDTLNTDNVEPSYHSNELLDHFRKDENLSEMSVEDTFKNAPDASPPFFQVPQILTGEKS